MLDRISSEPEKLGGRPCIRGLRIRVVDILDLLAAGLTHDEIVAELPDLELDDIKAALAFAARRVDHPLASRPGRNFKEFLLAIPSLEGVDLTRE